MSVGSNVTSKGSLLNRLIGLVLALSVTAIGVIVGIVQHQPIQQVILFAVVTLAGSAWAWQFFTAQFEREALAEEADNEGPSELRVAWAKYKQGVLGFFALLLAFAILSITVEGFLNVWNIISALILLVIIVLTMKIGRAHV